MLPREIGLHPLCKLAPCQEHTMTAPAALEPNVGAQTDDRPLKGSARVRLTQAYLVVQLKIRQHPHRSEVHPLL